jgi:Mn-dependent DtxR family transcriptional regulator
MMLQRVRAILEADADASPTIVAQRLGISASTVTQYARELGLYRRRGAGGVPVCRGDYYGDKP